jgi:hypothetical protein
MRAMAEQLHEYHPGISADEAVERLPGTERAVLMAEYARHLIVDGYISREEAEAELRSIFQ